jgi:hypothetical protein
MKYRKKMSRKGSAKVFKRGMSSKKVNSFSSPSRGGIRL